MANVNVYETTIRRTLSNNDVYGRILVTAATALQNKNIVACVHFHRDKPGYWEKKVMDE